MNIPKINITQNQKKIIILGGVIFFAFLLLWIFVYLPAGKEIRNLKSQLLSTEQQIQGIEVYLSGSENRDEAIRALEQKQQYLSSRFPSKEEESLRIITELARKNNIEVVSLQPDSKVEFSDASGKQLVIDGKTANYLPVALEVSCFYKDLVKYLSDLKSNLPAFASVNSLNIKKDGQLTGKVRVSVNFNLYLLI